MSPPGDNDRVRWQAVLSGVFRHRVGTLKCAFEVELAQAGVIDTATQLMREVIADWNRTTITYRLPSEVLSACFSYLSLSTLLSVTRVSRWWRVTALCCRELWSSVVFDQRLTKLVILRMIIERSGQLPLDLEFLSENAGKDEFVDHLETQIHRIRRIVWPSSRVDFLQKPAPMLESLDCETLCPVPEALLGGAPGRIALHMEGSPANAAPMFDDVETLSVTQRVGRGSPCIETTSMHGRRFTLVRREPWNATINFDALSSALAAIIRPHGALLGTLRVLRAPVTVLDALLLPAPAPVPHALHTLTVVVQMWVPEKQPAYSRALYGEPSPVFPAAQLACLSELCHSPLARIEVVARGLPGVAFTEGHARDVLATLAESLPARSQQEGTEVVLRFPGGLAISEDTLPSANGYRIVVQEGEKMRG